MLRAVRPALVSTVLFTLILGVAYPLTVTALAQILFPRQADGSLIRNGSGRIIGSLLIGQRFSRPQYLHPRPSAAGSGYDPTNSAGSNLGPLNPDLDKRVARAAAQVTAEDGPGPVPADAVTTSGSGLDPDISPVYAARQAARIARARGVSLVAVEAVITAHTSSPFLGFVGQRAVNVLAVNRALDERWPMAQP